MFGSICQYKMEVNAVKKLKFCTAVLLAAVMVLGWCVTGYADSSEEKIVNVNMIVMYTVFQAGTEASESDINVIIPTDTEYFLSDHKIINQPNSYWRNGTYPKLRITLESMEGYAFASDVTSRMNINIDCPEYEFVSASRTNQHKLTITIKLAAVEGPNPKEDPDPKRKGDPSGGPGVNNNNRNNYGPGAQSSSVTNPTSVTPGSATGGAWIADEHGWWFCNPDGSYPHSEWKLIDGFWYFFNSHGYMKAGWILWDNKWYFCGPDGKMWKNCYTPDGYWLGNDGVWTAYQY